MRIVGRVLEFRETLPLRIDIVFGMRFKLPLASLRAKHIVPTPMLELMRGIFGNAHAANWIDGLRAAW